MDDDGEWDAFAGPSHREQLLITNNVNDDDETDFCNESLQQMFDDEPFENILDNTKLRAEMEFCGFDNNTGDTWIYPTNYPIRQYQFNIISGALYRNTLVVLPTGLGKTFIAAVLIYNIYRWYPTGKILFMAPTRPLVAQQINACYNIMGISKNETVELTGRQTKAIRSVLWQSKRVFFVTPQVVQSDMHSPEQNFPLSDIRLIVIDEAHKAKGRYAYVDVVQSIAARNSVLRILALSATPGRTTEDVAEVVQNLLISHIEVRCENSIDVCQYTHKKNIRTVVVPLGDHLSSIRDELIDIIDPYVRNLIENNVVSGSTGSLHKGWLMMEQKRFQESCMTNRPPNYTDIMYDFSACVSLYHSLELLVRHGIRVFLNFYDDSENRGSEKYFVARDQKLKLFLDRLREETGPNPFLVNDETLPDGSICEIPMDLDFGHPKFQLLQKHLIEHFEKCPESKVIVFCEFRESVVLIHRLLLQKRPLIRPKIIVGQGSSAGIRAVTQKQQIASMTSFRNGITNTLIATCVAEEGIDVGEVDLIICFDINTKNPTRFVQRIGRTGRQRQGNVIMLVTEGREHEVLKDVLVNKDKTNQKITKNPQIIRNLYRKSPRMVPPEFKPKCLETFIKIPKEIESPEEKKKKSKPSTEAVTKKNGKKVKVNSKVTKPPGMKDMREFFKKVDPTVDTQSTQNTIKAISTERDAPEPIELIELEDEIESENEVDPSPLIAGSNELENTIMKKLRNFANKKPPIKRLKEVTLVDVIRKPENSDSFKKLLLEMNTKFIVEKIESSSVLSALVELPENEDLMMIDPEVENFKKDIQIIDSLFDGRENVNEHLEKVKKVERIYNRFSFNIDKTNLIELDEKEIEEIENIKENQIKLKQESRKPQSIVIEPPIIQDPSYTMMTSYTDNGISFNDTHLDASMNSQANFCEIIIGNESKYSESTPKPCSQVKSRLTKRLTDSANSPLMQAFNKSIKKRINSDGFGFKVETTPILNRNSDERSILNYFGLNSLEELFIDENETKVEQVIIPTVNKVPRKLFAKEEEDNEIITIPVEIDPVGIVISNDDSQKENNQPTHFSESVCTITQMMNLLNESTDTVKRSNISVATCSRRKSSIGSKSNKSLNKTKTRKSNDFDIGDLDEIFDSDDDMFAETVVETKSVDEVEELEVEVVEASPNKTQEYQLEEVIQESSKIYREKSSELFETSNLINSIPKSNSIITSTSSTPELQSNPNPIVMKSPSILRKKTNFSRLKSLKKTSPEVLSKPTTKTTIISSIPSSSSSNRSPFFMTCKERVTPLQSQNQQSQSQSRILIDESVIHPIQQKRKIRCIESDSDVGSDSEVFGTCRSKKSLESPEIRNRNSRREIIKNHKKRRKCQFLDLEAGASDDGSSDEHENGTQRGISIIVSDNEEDLSDENIDMHAKYLQSVKSPIRGRFKIPAQRQFNDISNIYSQPVRNDDDESYAEYPGDSFVVTESQAIYLTSSSSSEECPLERAEAILLARKKERWKMKNNEGISMTNTVVTGKKRRKIILPIDDSSGDDSDGVKSSCKKLKYC